MLFHNIISHSYDKYLCFDVAIQFIGHYWTMMYFQVYRPQNITTGNKTLLHIHDRKERKRDYKRYADQKQVSLI